MPNLSRRELLMAGGTGLVAAAGGAEALAAARETAAAGPAAAKKERWRLCLNISTIRPAPLEEKIAATAKAGYDGIELWSDELAKYEQGGQSLDDLGKRLKDLGLEVPNIIGIWNSMPQDEAAKAKLVEDARRRLAICAKVGAKHIAAIPAPDRPDMDVLWAAARYAELVDLGKEFGVGVGLEFGSFLKGIHTLGQAAAIVAESGRPEGSIVADTFHVHNGRSAWTGAKFLGGCIYAVWHFSDAPKEPPPGQMKDSDRLYPGDGILPLGQLLKDLWANGFRGPLSLEMFSREEWKKPAEEVAKTGIEKMRAVIAASGTGA
ncbi:MAG: sugar phosphate isomerase/epimerase [Planctomycetota bacterium]|nr:sugar phosphate isomerase/epimerase [Planctomycetota bacterium]